MIEIINIAVLSSIVFPLAYAFSVSLRSLKAFDLTLSIPFTAAGYGCVYASGIGLSHGAASIASLVAAVILYLVLRIFVLDRLRLLGASPLALLLACIGATTAFAGWIGYAFGSSPEVVEAGRALLNVSVSGRELTSGQVSSWAVLALCVGTVAAFEKSCFHLDLRALDEDPDLYRAIGFRDNRMQWIAGGLSAGLAAAAGFSHAMNSYVTPGQGSTFVMLGAASAMLSPGKNLASVLAAALAIAVAFNLFGQYVGADWQRTFVYALVLSGILLHTRMADAKLS